MICHRNDCKWNNLIPVSIIPGSQNKVHNCLQNNTTVYMLGILSRNISWSRVNPDNDNQTRQALSADKPSAPLDPLIPTWSTTSSNNNPSFSLSHIHAVCTWNYKDFIFVSSLMSTMKGLSIRWQSLVGLVVTGCWYTCSVTFPILPIDIENSSGLSKHTLSIISIS